jgi:hypothetical protein
MTRAIVRCYAKPSAYASRLLAAAACRHRASYAKMKNGWRNGGSGGVREEGENSIE